METTPDRGSTFRVFLPVSAERIIRQPDPAAQSVEMDEGGTVLLVDDEPMVRKVGEGALMSLGLRCSWQRTASRLWRYSGSTGIKSAAYSAI